ncbi:glycoside hydrolase family 113 [Gillisia sp. JM1]|uniref:glycoside hydrolase family 113 n=1 Tax=Gillisia sp. JM1 TaxID=1283286 RepID=UPI0006866D45|nr:glycoside hydrolase [Gillisia sp. JM1]
MHFRSISTFIRRRALHLQLIVVISLLMVIASCQGQKQQKKFNGVSLVASRESISSSHIKPILEINANAVAVMPFGFIKSLSSPDLKFNIEKQWEGERLEGARKTTQLLHSQGLKVMIKPQIWIWKGEFTGNIKMTSEEDWKKFETNYEEFILLYAKMADEENVELFCIGTELYAFANERTEFWEQLITKVRKIFKGKLTYAENWDKVEKVNFWTQLDFIGVDAYFPLSEGKSPNIEELRASWKPHKTQLKDLSNKYDRKVLFTEYGYRNTNYATKQPWDSSRKETSVNNELQSNALMALYQEFWREDWFSGGFLWKWFHNHEQAGGLENNQFTPQNKPALKVVKGFYGEMVRD